MAEQELEPRPDDAESLEVIPATQTGPVVNPATRKTTFADLMTRHDERRPIVPASLRSKAGRHALLTLLVAAATHEVAWQLSRSPLYASKAFWYAPRGAWRAVARPVWWARAEEGNWHLRQSAASRDDPGTWMALDARRMRQSRWRWWVLAVVAVVLLVGVLAGRQFAPGWAQALVVVGLVATLARLGRNPDKPILERAWNTARFVRLTAELTRAALVASGAGIKDPAAVKFNREIYRDGPGYTAELTLPTGVIATDVIDKRDYLAAGFQLPVAQVWPDPVPGAHPGVLAIWVADRPVDRMKNPESTLLTCGELDFWGPLPFGVDVRMRPISWRLDERNSLFGGMPGSGKSLAARVVGLGAALDPLTQFVIFELKGSGDMDSLGRLCPDGLYVSGADQHSKERAMNVLRWLDGECDVRGPLINAWAKRGLNSQNKLNRAIALADPRLPPVLAIMDELQELLNDPVYGKEAKVLLTSTVKRGRSLGIHLMLATQRIDKESAPKGVTSNVSNRMALAVPSHTEVDLILGTGAYHNGARPTTFIPPAHGDNPWAGWGYLAGLAQPIRAAYVDNPTADAIVDRAVAMRSGRTLPADADRSDRDVVRDVIRVFATLGKPGAHWKTLAELLAAERPELYAGMTPLALSAQMRSEGVPTVNVTVDGTTLKGCRLDAVRKAADRRQINA